MRAIMQIISLFFVLLTVVFSNVAQADTITDFPNATVTFQNDTTISIQPIERGIRRGEPVTVRLFGVAMNPNGGGMANAWYARAYPARVVHVRVIMVNDPRTGRTGDLGALVSVNGNDLGKAMVQNGFLSPSGICQEFSSKSYCSELLRISSQSPAQQQSRGVQQYGPQRLQQSKAYNPNNPWINPNNGGSANMRQSEAYQLPTDQKFWDQTRDNVNRQLQNQRTY